ELTGPGEVTTGNTSTSDGTTAATTGCALAPLFPDLDDDGYGAGEAVLACPGDPGFAEVDGDCDDADAEVQPGALERCNTIDDDCDGLRDEFSPANAACLDCELAEFGAHSYWFCTNTLGWDDARAVCQS